MLTFREFYEICEGKKPETPPHAVSGTVSRDSSGTLTYTLQSYDGPARKPTKKEIKKNILDKSGGKKVEKHSKRVAKSIKKIEEDLESRREELRQRRLDQIELQKQKVSNYREAQQERMQAVRDRIEQETQERREKEAAIRAQKQQEREERRRQREEQG